MTEWQPIETAPKDQWIFVYEGNVKRFSVKNCYVCQWAYADQFWYEKTSNIPDITRLKNNITTYLTCRPTHWMPLPEPPK
jgi:hypothetical protein